VVEAVRGRRRARAAAGADRAGLAARPPAVSASIVGATKTRHVDDAIAALEVALRDEESARLEAPYRPHPVIGHG
jgi:1-deoxyxylulose-5-phosphate synthase